MKHLTNSRKIKHWVEDNDHYYLNQKLEREGDELLPIDDDDDEITYCEVCFLQDHEARRKRRNFLRTNSKLIGFELFSGEHPSLISNSGL